MRRRTLVVPFVPGANNTGPTDPLASSALVVAAAALAAGDDAAFSTTPVYFDDGLTTSEEACWEWQSFGLFDPVRGYAHYFGKPAGQDEAWSHRYFDLAANTWYDGGSNMWDNIGHVYGNVAIDPSTGDVYIARGGLDGNSVDNYKRIRRWDFATKSWGSNLVPVSKDIYASGLAQMGNGLAYHPDLFGAGVGGLALDTDFRHCFWRNTGADTIYDDAHASQSEFGAQYGIGLYWEDEDALIMGGAGGKPLAKIVPNGSSTPTVTTFATPPINTEGNSSAATYGSLHVHPGDPTKLILLEHRGSERWWICDSSGTFDRKDDDFGPHPFSFDGPYVVIPIAGRGVLWCLGFDGSTSTFYSRIWKPDV